MVSLDKEVAALRREVQDLRSIIKTQRHDVEIWKEISSKAYARIDELESEGAAAVLKRERDHWRASWRNCTRRLADKIEHLGLDHSGNEPSMDSE